MYFEFVQFIYLNNNAGLKYFMDILQTYYTFKNNQKMAINF